MPGNSRSSKNDSRGWATSNGIQHTEPQLQFAPSRLTEIVTTAARLEKAAGESLVVREVFHKLFSRRTQSPGVAFSRPLVVLQSDDWGRVGVRDREGHEQLRARGLRLGEHPYDLYTLETAGDVMALAALLGRHHDSTGRSPCSVMNFCTANMDFKKMRDEGFTRVQLLPLAQGLPG